MVCTRLYCKVRGVAGGVILIGTCFLCTARTTLAAPLADVDKCAAYMTRERCEDKAPDSLKCIWWHGSPGDFDAGAMACMRQGCDTIAQNQNAEEECEGIGGCSWHADASACTVEGALPACELYYANPAAGEHCPSYCEFNAVAGRCIEKGGKAPCDMIYQPEACADNGCVYNTDIYKCWAAGEAIPCIEFEYYSQESCPSYCKWVLITKETGTCVGKDELLACEVFDMSVDGSMCPPDRCKWYEMANTCYPKDKNIEAIPCSKLSGELCANAAKCKWFVAAGADAYTGTCGECQTYVGSVDDDDDTVDHKGCPQTWNGHGSGGDDTGADCDTYTGETMYDCPEPRCTLSWPNGGTGHRTSTCNAAGSEIGEFCRNPVCSDYQWDNSSCLASASLECEYHEASGLCRDPALAFPCDRLYSESHCTKEDTCAWKPMVKSGDDIGFCYVSAAPIPCSNYDEEEAFCPTDGPGAACKWMRSTFACYEKDYTPTCDEYGAAGECPAADGCAWQVGICWPEGKELPCEAFCTAFLCDNSGSCQFNSNENVCEDCDAGGCREVNACSSYSSEESCPESNCVYAVADPDEYGSDTQGTCKDKVCVNLHTKVECEAYKKGPNDCSWIAGARATEGSCFRAGFIPPCNHFYGGVACDAADGCRWNADEYECQEISGAVTRCHDFTPDECGTGDAEMCEVSKSGYECYVKQSLEPATPPPLPGNGDGTGNEDEANCTPAAYNLVKGKLEVAEEECIVVGRLRNRRDAGDDEIRRLECLAYFLAQSPNPTTVADACPCLWFYANEVSPWEDHWMQIAC